MLTRRTTIIFSVLLMACIAQAAFGQANPASAESAESVIVASGASGIGEAGPVPAAGAIDPADDPWLSEEGPAVPVPVALEREIVMDRWTAASPTAPARAASVMRTRLELGLGDLAAPARAILRASSDAEERRVNGQLARDLAPGVPGIQFANAKAQWENGDSGAAINSMIDAAKAASLHVEAQLWFLENVSIVLVMVVLGASIAFMGLAALMVYRNAAHDLGDLLSSQTPAFARCAALAALLLIPLALGEGVIGLALALFVLGFAYGSRAQRNSLAMAAVLLVVGLHPLAMLATTTTSILEETPAIESLLAVANGIETNADVERLEALASDDLVAAHALAYRARRIGLEEEARERLDEIAVRYPADPVMLTNRGNIEMRRGQIQPAIEYYEQAAAVLQSPTIYFDLSQAYAAAFRMEEYERSLERAQQLDVDAIAALSRLEDAKLVADLGLPFGRIQRELISIALAEQHDSAIAATLAPGLLGKRWFNTAAAFALATLFCLLFANRFDHASLCTRCGHRICTRCEETVWSEEICEDCNHLFRNPQDTDPSLRMARLQALSERDVRLDRVWLAASLLIPGAAGFASRRPDLAMFGLLLFGCSAAWILWPSGILVDPLLLGTGAWLFLAVPGVLSVLGYITVVSAGLVARKNR